MNNKILIVVLAVIAISFVFYLAFNSLSDEISYPEEINQEEQKNEENPETETERDRFVALANPSATYCEEEGGELESFTFANGEDAYCLFEDGSKCWQWDFFQNDCKKGELIINIKEYGEGEPAKIGDTVLINYTGELLNGEIFDSSFGLEEPFSFNIGAKEVITGWDQGILGMKQGEIRELIISPRLAHGEKVENNRNQLAGETLIFEIELLEIK